MPAQIAGATAWTSAARAVAPSLSGVSKQVHRPRAVRQGEKGPLQSGERRRLPRPGGGVPEGARGEVEVLALGKLDLQEFPHRRLGAGHHVAHAGAVRHLVEAVLRRLRADLHRLEQDVVSRIARHNSVEPLPKALAQRR